MGGLNLKETESVSPLFLLNYSKLKYRTDFKFSQSFWWEFNVRTMKKKIIPESVCCCGPFWIGRVDLKSRIL